MPRQSGRPRVWSAVAATAYVLVLLWATLNPSAGPATASVGALRAVADAMGLPVWVADAAEPLANVAIFVPLPFLAALLGRVWSARAWLLIGLLTSSSIEVLQRVALAGRSPSLLDIAANTTDAVIGAVLLRWAVHVRSRRPVPSPAYVETRGN